MKVDLIIKDVRVFNSYFKKFYKTNVAILDKKFLYIGNDDIDKLKAKRTIDGEGSFMVPGLIDIHMHIEASMSTPYPFSIELLKNGVTTIVAEPHEIANVFGVAGIKAMMLEGKNCPIDIFWSIPSSVPASSTKLETAGCEIGINEIKELAELDNVICLGEVMNYLDIINEPDSKTNRIVNFVRENYPNYIIEGHCPKLKGLDLAMFIFQGIDSDHTQNDVEGISQRIANGMFVELQDKTLVKENIDFIMKNNLYEHFCIVTDDVMADTLVEKGHLNSYVKKAISLGLPPEYAIYMATYTPARRMNLRDRGSIAPGKKADFILLDSLEKFSILKIFKDGKEMREKIQGTLVEGFEFPKEFYQSVKMCHIDKDDLKIKINRKSGKVKCRIIQTQEDGNYTKEIIDELDVVRGEIDWEGSPYCLVAVFERHGKNNNIALGLTTGAMIKRGAVATTYSHDAHNLIAVGKNALDIVKAVNTIIDSQGGYCVVEDGKILAMLELPIAGILSKEPMEQVARKVRKVRKAMGKLGYKHINSIMNLSTLSLVASPELKITDKGLVLVSKAQIVELKV